MGNSLFSLSGIKNRLEALIILDFCQLSKKMPWGGACGGLVSKKHFKPIT